MSEQSPPPPPPVDPTPTPTATPTPNPFPKASPAGSILGPANPDEKNLGMLAHLLGIFTFFVGPLIIWLIKKDQSKYIDEQAKEALNFQIAASIVLFGCSIFLIIPLVNCVMLIVVLAAHVARLVFSIIGTVGASKGEMYRYPYTFRLIT
jgi:uncharacterized protein